MAPVLSRRPAPPPGHPAANRARFALRVLPLLLAGSTALAQSPAAPVEGIVLDPSGAGVAGAVVRLTNGTAESTRETVAEPDGTFRLSDVPSDTWSLQVEAPGFAPYSRRFDPGLTAPLRLEVQLDLAAHASSVTVAAEERPGDASPAATRHVAGAAAIERLPAAVGSRSLESVLVSFPGFAQNANGAIHPRGAHNQMTFVIDGLPISDQLTGAFANALDSSIVETVEMLTGNIPAEYGSKVSGVAVISSRSGLAIGRRLAGDVTIGRAGFGTWHANAQAGGGTGRVGYFGSVAAMRTDRFLDQVSLDNDHNRGAFGRMFARADLVLSSGSLVRVNAMAGRSAFDVANLRSQEAAGQDQRQALGDAAAWASYLRTIGPQSSVEGNAGYRTTSARLRPSVGDRPVTAAQRRQLSTFTLSGRYSTAFGSHGVRAGADYQRFPVREHFTMGITSPSFNDPASASFNPRLLAHDLTRGGVPFVFDAAQAGTLWSGFLQASLRWRAATTSLGVRYDAYRFLVRGNQLQPRAGLSWQLPASAGVVRLSYNRNYQTPPNENLLLSNSEAAARLAPETVRQAFGGAHRPIYPERQDVVEAGYRRNLGSLATVDLSAYHKRSRDQQDNNNFFDTGIIFPTTLAAIRVTGAEARLTVRERRGVSGTLSATTGRAISTPPFTGGLFLGQDAVDLLSSGPFAIDHDQRLSMHGTVQFDPEGPLWFASSVRYDSGLVSNPSNPQAVANDPDFADLLPYVDLVSPVPRVRPRTIVDAAAGYDLRRASARTWSLQVQVTNLTNARALYNFQSVFVGTRLVQPRTLAVRVRRHF